MSTITPTQPLLPTPKQGTNGLAVASLVLSILWMFGLGSLLAVVFGAVARKQTGESGQGGSGLATAGLVIGIVGLVGAAIIIVLAVAAGHSVSAYDTCVANASTLAQQAAC